METYADKLEQFVFRTGLVMKPIFDKACEEPKRVAFAEGEDDRVLFAAKVLLDDGIATPILVGRPLVISHRARKLGLEFVPGKDFEIVNPEDDDRYRDYWQTYHSIMARKGVSPDSARTIVRTNSTVIASLMVEKGDADAMICGSYGEYKWHLKYVEEVLGLCAGVRETSALSLLVLDRGPIFICDTYVSENPDADEIVDLTVRAAEKVADGAGVVRGTPCRPDSARHRQARSYHHAVGDLTLAGQLGRARRDRCAGARAPRDPMTPRHAFR
jgi:malate dehydrogenase (oxaloacetate-decarboxylating)(NADP+)